MNNASPPVDGTQLDGARLEALLASIPYAALLGLRAELHGDELTLILPYQPKLIGNPLLPALHGGAIGAFMELTAMIQIAVALREPSLPKTIDIGIDYLRSGRPVDTFARARIAKLGRRIVNARAEAWQHQVAEPIAALHGHFLVPTKDEPETQV